MAASEVGTWDQRMLVARVRGCRQSAGRHGAEGTVGGPGAGVRPRDSQQGQGLSQAALGGAQVSATARCPELGCCLGTPPPPPWPIGPCVGVGTPFVSLQPSRRQRGTGEPWRQVFKGVGWSGRLLRRAAEAMTGEGGRRGRGAPSMVLPRGGRCRAAGLSLAAGPRAAPSSLAQTGSLGGSARPGALHLPLLLHPRPGCLAEHPPGHLSGPAQHPRAFSSGPGHLWSASGWSLGTVLAFPPGKGQPQEALPPSPRARLLQDPLWSVAASPPPPHPAPKEPSGPAFRKQPL